jgi:TPR repeat protein
MENLKRVLDAHEKSIIDEEMGTENGGGHMKAHIKFLLITGVFSLLVSCTGKEKVQQTMSDEDLKLILTEAQLYLEKKDFVSAAGCFQKVAEQGNAMGELYWGLFLFTGAGVDKDLSKAARLWKRALKHPFSDDSSEETSQLFRGLFFNLGNAYNDGEGVRKKKSEAVFWYRKAAECGMPLAQFSLGSCYALGKGVKEDKNAALYWLEKAIGSGELDKESNTYAVAMMMKLRQSGASSSKVKADGNPFTGKVSENTSAKKMDAVFDANTKTLTITGKGDMIDYNDDIEAPWES